MQTNTPSSTRRAKTALIVGATSSLAGSLCRKLAASGYNLILAARDERELEIRAGDLHARYETQCTTLVIDLQEKHFSAAKLIERAGSFDTLIFAAGDMGTAEQDDLANLAHVAQVNYVVPSQILSVAAEAMSESGGGQIVVIGSVAGDRGRASNYEYGAAKAALATFASGLRGRYAQRGIHVMTVKPGFTDTPMTWGMHSPLMSGRDNVAETIAEAIVSPRYYWHEWVLCLFSLGLIWPTKQKNILYVPWFWEYIMLVIRLIPESIFKKLKL